MKRWLIIGVLCGLGTTGCVVFSFNPFYTKAAVVKAGALNGKWHMLKQGGEEDAVMPWVIAGDKITTYDHSGKKGVLNLVLFKVGDHLFA